MQVKQEVSAQIIEHLPISLQEQAEQSKRQLNDVKLSLINSYVLLYLPGYAITWYIVKHDGPILAFGQIIVSLISRPVLQYIQCHSSGRSLGTHIET